jgi:cytochrome c556
MKAISIIAIVAIVGLALPLGAAFQQPDFRPVATVAELMSAIVIPASDVVFGAAGEPPKDQKAWDKVRGNAITLAESGNLLLMRAPSSNNANWMKFSRALINAGETAAKAAKAKNVDAVSDAGNDVYETCDGCHKQYLKR